LLTRGAAVRRSACLPAVIDLGILKLTGFH
jgi:hypothetical protein